MARAPTLPIRQIANFVADVRAAAVAHSALRGSGPFFVAEHIALRRADHVRHYVLHTNGIESVWSLFKRQILGAHHFLSPKHFGRYLGEMTWRFNLRKMGEGDRVNGLFVYAIGAGRR